MDSLSAIVSVADDGGSTGKLIQEFDVLPPGDIRKLLVALSDADELVGRLFEYRFSSHGDLGGHTVGNLLLIALTELNGGSFPKAIQAASKLLAVRGSIIPVSLNYMVLCAELADADIVRGESNIPKRVNREPIRRVFLEPRENGKNYQQPGQPYCVANPEAVDAIADADAIMIGPGSLYTSIIPNLVVKGIAEMIQSSEAMKIYICNVMTQPGETDGYSVTDHVQAILNHADLSLDYVVVNNQPASEDVSKNYVLRELWEQFTRIKMRADEALLTLKEQQGHAVGEVFNLTKHISQLSEETKQIADASKVQIFYSPERDRLGNVKVIEEDLIRETVIIEHGTPITVIRHDPEKLARTLVKLLNNHPKLHEQI